MWKIVSSPWLNVGLNVFVVVKKNYSSILMLMALEAVDIERSPWHLLFEQIVLFSKALNTCINGYISIGTRVLTIPMADGNTCVEPNITLVNLISFNAS